MSVPDCPICWNPLSQKPAPAVEEKLSATICGHAFHEYCLNRSLETSENKLCPMCKSDLDLQGGVGPLYLKFVDSYIKECEDKLQNMELEKNQFKKKLVKISAEKRKLEEENFNLKTEVEEFRKFFGSAGAGSNDQNFRFGDFGSRVHLRNSFEDSLCMNCESLLHKSVDCPSPPILRNKEKTTFGGWVQVAPYEMLAVLHGEKAGYIIKYFEDNELPMEITRRREVQMLWAFVYFDEGCWICGSPFHHRPDCKEDKNPDCTRFARFLYSINHPEKHAERKLRFQKYSER